MSWTWISSLWLEQEQVAHFHPVGMSRHSPDIFKCNCSFKCTLDFSDINSPPSSRILQKLVEFVDLASFLAFEHLRQAGKHNATIKNAESNLNTTENFIKVSEEILLLFIINGYKITFIYSALGTYSIGSSDTDEEDYLLFIQLLKDEGTA